MWHKKSDLINSVSALFAYLSLTQYFYKTTPFLLVLSRISLGCAVLTNKPQITETYILIIVEAK